ncbi:sigma-70 family RNA polymerase sigma factor [Pseudomonas sp. RP23018S]|uniref:sigma-70 family RNA polymerase sigma factor n=1 Tax=Pseudomonas sp. RP23018S TaxID=3096037 RepID=UPI002ACA9F47|nr:sigma-70 family RNA polymerase sigma factor [Pseudomonas sp. RP23018S]MDZ5604574.1 sigma-70 family RNA polymerase sigma factor [Pseudomonas sp. RP23018S]
MSSPHALDHSVHRLYLQHSPWLLRFLGRRLGNRMDAPDLLHDTFMRVLGRPCLSTDEAGERSFLAAIASGLCIDRWRRQEVERAYLAVLANQPIAVQPSPEHSALVLETLVEVDAMLASLPMKVREAFILAQLDGMPYHQISERLGVSERMVKKYMAQAFVHCAVLGAELDGVLVE